MRNRLINIPFEGLRQSYPKVEPENFKDGRPIPPVGTKGTVIAVDDIGKIWPNGITARD